MNIIQSQKTDDSYKWIRNNDSVWVKKNDFTNVYKWFRNNDSVWVENNNMRGIESLWTNEPGLYNNINTCSWIKNNDSVWVKQDCELDKNIWDKLSCCSSCSCGSGSGSSSVSAVGVNLNNCDEFRTGNVISCENNYGWGNVYKKCEYKSNCVII